MVSFTMQLYKRKMGRISTVPSGSFTEDIRKNMGEMPQSDVWY